MVLAETTTDRTGMLKVRSKEQTFSTSKSLYFRGKDEGSGGTLKISVEARGTTTADMVKKLEELTLEMQQRAKEIVEEQTAPQQFLK